MEDLRGQEAHGSPTPVWGGGPHLFVEELGDVRVIGLRGGRAWEQ